MTPDAPVASRGPSWRRQIRRVLIAIVGGSLTAIGIVLLVLPGPGFVVIAAGLAALAREFTWAARPLNYAKKQADEGLRQVARSWVFATLDALAGGVLIAVGVLDLTVGLPIVDPISDGFTILSGLFLIGTVGYARRRGSSERPAGRTTGLDGEDRRRRARRDPVDPPRR